MSRLASSNTLSAAAVGAGAGGGGVDGCKASSAAIVSAMGCANGRASRHLAARDAPKREQALHPLCKLVLQFVSSTAAGLSLGFQIHTTVDLM